jgi:hypothetical protein
MKKITLLFATILKENWIELFSLQTNCYITFFFSKLLQSMRNLKMKMGALQYIAPCSLARVDRRFRDVYCIHHQVRDGDYTALYIPEGSHLHTRRRENLKYQPKMFTWNTSQSNLRTFNICRADLQHKIHFLQYAIDAFLRKIDETLEKCRTPNVMSYTCFFVNWYFTYKSQVDTFTEDVEKSLASAGYRTLIAVSSLPSAL